MPDSSISKMTVVKAVTGITDASKLWEADNNSLPRRLLIKGKMVSLHEQSPERRVNLRSTMATMYGRIDESEAHNEDWKTYVEYEEMFCDANGIENDKHIAILLSCVGAKKYGLPKSLTAPAKPSEKSYRKIVDILKNHITPSQWS